MTQLPRFTWTTTDGITHEFDLAAAEVSIGRAPTCDIVLGDDQMVSRRHAIVRRQNTVITVMDLGSSNGTLVNGAEIHDATMLKDGDRLTIGDHDLMFSIAKESDMYSPVAVASAPAVETIRIGGPSTPVGSPAASYSTAEIAESIAQSPPTTEGLPLVTDAAPPAQAFVPEPEQSITERNTGDLEVVSGMQAVEYTHTIGDQIVEHESAAAFQMDMRAPAAPTRPDAAALLATIQSLHAQLSDQIATTDQAVGQVRDVVRAALAQLDAALSTAQSGSQQAALGDLRQLADAVSQAPLMDQVSSFAHRAGEVRDVVAAHDTLLTALQSVRQQLENALGT